MCDVGLSECKYTQLFWNATGFGKINEKFPQSGLFLLHLFYRKEYVEIHPPGKFVVFAVTSEEFCNFVG